MAKCDQCGRQENMPYRCRYCGGTFCGDHRLPENHACPGLEEWNDPRGVFDSGFDDSARHPGGRSGKLLKQVPVVGGSNVARRGVLGYFRGNVAYTFLALMWITYLLQWVTIIVGGGAGPNSLHETLFVLHPAHLEYVWTWVTSIFAHSPANFFHIVGNSIVLYFFGPVLERQIGSKRFAVLFLVSGVIAGLAQVGIVALRPVLFGGPAVTVYNSAGVLGASGAILAVLGVLTVLNPHLTVYLYFLLPVPLWLITIGYAVLSIIGVVSSVSVLGGNVANLAHLAGLVIGLAYGEWLRRHGTRGPKRLEFGSGPGPGGPRRRF